MQELSDADITVRARELAQGASQQGKRRVAKADELELKQMSMFDTVSEQEIIKEILELELNRMSPIDALNTLDKLQARLRNRWTNG